MSKLPKNWLEDHNDELLEFIYESFQYRYAHGTVEGDDSPIGSEPSFKWEKGNWMYRDWFWGGEPFSGIIVISWRENPARDWIECWTMSVNGSLAPDLGEQQIKDAYKLLDTALKNAPKSCPVRGPDTFELPEISNVLYSNTCFDVKNDLEDFSGFEYIICTSDDNRMLYEGNYYVRVINTLY